MSSDSAEFFLVEQFGPFEHSILVWRPEVDAVEQYTLNLLADVITILDMSSNGVDDGQEL